MWTTVAFRDEAKNLISQWGFEYKSELVWCKPGLGTGEYWRLSHEYLYLGVRGSLGMMSSKHRSRIEAPRACHSEKPEIVREMIEEGSPPPRLEMFSRREVEGWVTWGNQVMDS